MPEQITCPHCRTTTSTSSDLCSRCGKEIPDYLKEGTLECPKCLEITSAVEETCRRCGKPIPEYLLAHSREKLEKAAARDKAEAAKVKALPPDKAQPAPQQSDVGVAEKEPEAKVETPTVAAKVRPVAPQAVTMKLLIRRNQKTGMISRRITFTIDARVELSPEMGALVKKYKLGKEVLYQNFTIVDPGSGLFGYLSRWYFRHFGGAVSVIVNDLVRGKHIECKDIIEMHVFEDRLKEACGTFKYMLDSAAHFGGEEVIEL